MSQIAQPRADLGGALPFGRGPVPVLSTLGQIELRVGSATACSGESILGRNVLRVHQLFDIGASCELVSAENVAKVPWPVFVVHCCLEAAEGSIEAFSTRTQHE